MDAMQIVEYNNVRVITTRQVADAYGTDEKNVSKQFNRHKEKYTEGKHYYKLSGNDMKEFCNRQNDENKYPVVSSKARVLYLWTERGALLLAKSINTDTAWEAYERLVDFYFDKKEEAKLSTDLLLEEPEGYNVSLTTLPKKPSWFNRNNLRMSWICNQIGCSRSKLYHYILMKLGEEYDLDYANQTYEQELGYKPHYAMDIVSYFPQLSQMADDYLDIVISNIKRKKNIT